ncbi:MAG: hypothetical protein LBN93_02360 [Candidatus Symbiothrix sp.]|jgi:hypothetical protein|nr:hypothetical protein [Candidatus Symbiothrix sp.]
MKKNRLITLLTVLGITLSSIVYGQGIFNDDSNAASSTLGSDVLVVTDAPVTNDPNALNVGEPPLDPGNFDDAPIGEGIAILSVLAAGYGVAKRRKKN